MGDAAGDGTPTTLGAAADTDASVGSLSKNLNDGFEALLNAGWSSELECIDGMAMFGDRALVTDDTELV